VTTVTSYSVDSTNNTTFVPTATAIVSSGAQAVDFIQPDVGPALLMELKQAGYKGVTMSYTVPPALYAAAGAAADGMVMPVSFTPLSVRTPLEAAFIKGYSATFKTSANANSAEAYDSILFIAAAIKNAKSDTRAAIDKSAAALVKSKAGFTGVEGHFKFANREGNLPTILTIFGRLATPVAVVNP
jgi:ABC-type branched-subunit amino acid transport system substrate-binding protein